MKNYTDTRRNFQDNYIKNIKPFLKKSEIERKQTVKKIITLCGIFFVIGLLFAFIFPYIITQLNTTTVNQIYKISTWQIILFIIFSILSPIAILLSSKKIFELTFKANAMSKMNNCFQKLKHFQGQGYGFLRDIFKESLLVDYYDGICLDDVFKGEWNKTFFEIMEIKLAITGNIPQILQNITINTCLARKIFSGTIIKINLTKPVHNHIIIRPQDFLNETEHRLFPVDVKDVAFNCKCDIFASDKNNAQEIITAEFAQELSDISRVFKSKKLSCALYKNNLLIALHDAKNMFSAQNLFETIENNKQFFDSFDNILAVYKLIDLFSEDFKTD